jgi:hypothetical protein
MGKVGRILRRWVNNYRQDPIKQENYNKVLELGQGRALKAMLRLEKILRKRRNKLQQQMLHSMAGQPYDHG